MAKETKTANWPDGARYWEAEFEDGVENGKYRSWHADGEPWEEGQFVNGKRNGTWTMKTSNVEVTMEMRDNQVVHHVKKRNGKIVEEKYYGRDGKPLDEKP